MFNHLILKTINDYTAGSRDCVKVGYNILYLKLLFLISVPFPIFTLEIGIVLNLYMYMFKVALTYFTENIKKNLNNSKTNR